MLTIYRVTFGVVLLMKFVDLAYRTDRLWGTKVAIVASGLWFVAAAAIIAGFYVRIAAALIIALCAVLLVASSFALYNQHLYLIASICLVFVINREVALLLRIELSIVYGIAALAKLNEGFLAGNQLHRSLIDRPFWEAFIGWEPSAALIILASIATLGAEAFLAIGFWLRRVRWIALVVGVGLHLGMLVLVSLSPSHLLTLAVFGALLVTLYIPFFEPECARLLERLRVRFPRIAGTRLPIGGSRLGLRGRFEDARA